MTTQLEALRLADEMERVAEYDHQTQAAAELRRLYEVNQELLEALQNLMAGAVAMGWSIDKARAAIAKATGEQA